MKPRIVSDLELGQIIGRYFVQKGIKQWGLNSGFILIRVFVSSLFHKLLKVLVLVLLHSAHLGMETFKHLVHLSQTEGLAP